MRSRRHILLLLAVLATVAAPFATVRAEEPIPLEFKVKAAFLNRFLKFVTWPHAALPPDQKNIVVGVVGDSPMARALQAIEDKTVHGRSMTVRILADPSELAGCHAVYVPDAPWFTAAAADSTRRLLSSLAGTPVLTIGDSAAFIRDGGDIRFFIANERVRFEIGPEASHRAKMQISSNLLRLGQAVER